ncbi:quinone-dependent dihydroorotate dehydrogenase [Mangrovibrevibacter kandeliae]|uniref:quinone-dependent dihydroorotate dehydrogenase n=1 Tax=Mangrovibrevibacter kandeliae TaxID=2968473 RepID=UPI0021185D82|nr:MULTISPECIES: quinone-dependent dihydroorotate dehydrogenase [unclassified Aurantimonas]MCQ8783314.1 quinone-dependent dihydroorotate dehydrogenase [Aurantimonas sp. CSK15Z-1]MCW4116172.1 quinone-dependent dihydroorotate dehydrogenase [Aurantimonas sp. MSK8Z-1]
MKRAYALARPLLFKLEPERAHRLSIEALKHGLVPRRNLPIDARLRVSLAGINFPNPIGLAAGYDKDAEVPDAALRLGFGFAEVGTITPKPQDGNPQPRVFRLESERALINRLGFNNGGEADAFERMQARVRKPGIVGVNVGANKETSDRIADYVSGISLFEPVASYLTVNISSPNTPGLRDLQAGDALDKLLAALVAARNGLAAIAATKRKPLFVKVAPDLDLLQIQEIAAVCKRHKADGLIVSNTTLSRPRTMKGHPLAEETGGLSGRPLFARSTWALAAFRRAVGRDFPVIGVGGVDGPEAAIAKFEAGADLVQLYTGLVYEGPDLPLRILNGLVGHLDRVGARHVLDLKGRRVDEILEAGPPTD